jgi:hypothetical protein
MDLEKFLSQEKATIVERWLDLVLETYPPQTATLMKKETNQFANPVGYSTRHGLESIYEEFLGGLAPEKVNAVLDGIIRIRAVQDFTPSRAIGFVFSLKQVVRQLLEEAREKARKKGDAGTEPLVSAEEMEAFDSKVDHLALLAMDVYSQCREKLYEVRVGEVKNRSFRLLQRANLLVEIPEMESGVRRRGKTLKEQP